jgi:hypothetical protein
MILMQLSDREISMVCQANKYVNSLCEDGRFWLNRLLLTFTKYSPVLAKDIKDYLEFDAWKEFYNWLRVQELKYKDPQIHTKIIESLNKKAVIDETVELFKKVKLSKWINPVAFYKAFKRHAFINVHKDLNEDYTEPVWDESEISKIEWKTYHSFADEDLVQIFADEWHKVYKNI